MINKHISHYFDTVEGFMRVNTQNSSIAVLNGLLEDSGCPKDSIDALVNGSIVDLLMDNITPEGNTVQVFDRYGCEKPDVRFNPTKAELIKILTQKRFVDLDKVRAEQLIDCLIKKSYLKEADGLLYRGTVPLRRVPFQL